MTHGVRSRPLRSRTGVVDSLIEAVDESVAMVCGHAPDRVGREIAALLREPVTRYLEHVHWPSNLTGPGVPVELSLALDEKGRAAFRCAADIADHHRRLAGNWQRYLDTAAVTTGAPVDVLWRLLADHADVNPPTLRSPVYHGIGYAAGDVRRSSLYFFIGGLAKGDFEQRFAPQAAAIDESLTAQGRRPNRYHGVAYDFNEKSDIYRTKFYAWLDLEKPLLDLAEVLGRDHDLQLAQTLMDHLREYVGARTVPRCTLLQSSVSGARLACRHKLFINCERWNLDRPEALLEIVTYLSRESTIDPSPLYAVLSVFGACGVPLRPQWVAVGPGTSAPSVTFYFAPVLEPALDFGQTDPGAVVQGMLRRAIRFLLAQRLPDGSWQDGPRGAPAHIVTAHLAATLANVRELEGDLRSTGEWLANRLGQDPVMSDAETGLQARVALRRLGVSEQIHTAETSLESSPPEVAALELLLLAETGQRNDTRVRAILDRLLQRERWIGGWSGAAADISVTTRVVEGLAAVTGTVSGSWPQAVEMLDRAAYVYSEHPVPSEPAHIATWLKGLLLCGRDLSKPSVERAIAHLSSLQQSDGRWLAAPFEESSGRRAYLDPSCLLTTALVAEALSMLRDRLVE